MSEKRRTCVYFTAEEIRQLKILAATQDTSMNKLVRKQVQKLIEEDRKEGKSNNSKT